MTSPPIERVEHVERRIIARQARRHRQKRVLQLCLCMFAAAVGAWALAILDLLTT